MEPGAASLAKRRSSKSRDRDTGYDALNGLNDGEADLDESAPQANFGSEAYMRGVEGVEYQFPRHRLRRSMKGELDVDDEMIGLTSGLDESKIPVVIGKSSVQPGSDADVRFSRMWIILSPNLSASTNV
jgi:hypothetical protein